MRLTIEILIAAMLLSCITPPARHSPQGQGGPECRWPELLIQRSGNAPPAARCAAIRRHAGGKFYAITAETRCCRRCEL